MSNQGSGKVSAVELIKGSVRLSEYVSRYTKEKLTGRDGRFRTHCPIHGGDNPTAFSIDDSLGLWNCHSGGCGGGSVLDFWMKINDSSDLSDAIDGLSGELNIALPERDPNSWSVSKRKVKKALADIAEEAHINLMKDSDGALGKDYLRERRCGKQIGRADV